jgi:hypothetical protein
MSRTGPRSPSAWNWSFWSMRVSGVWRPFRSSVPGHLPRGRTSCYKSRLLVSQVSLPTTLSFVKSLLADERQLGPEIFF